MYPLAEGGWLIDTPGIKGFGLIDLDGAEIARYFPELFRLAPGCSYYNCTHTHEPGCAVKEALSRGEVSLSRYESYLKLLDDDEKYRR
jgi:ribosome biogenesis GTPase